MVFCSCILLVSSCCCRRWFLFTFFPLLSAEQRKKHRQILHYIGMHRVMCVRTAQSFRSSGGIQQIAINMPACTRVNRESMTPFNVRHLGMGNWIKNVRTTRKSIALFNLNHLTDVDNPNTSHFVNTRHRHLALSWHDANNNRFNRNYMSKHWVIDETRCETFDVWFCSWIWNVWNQVGWRKQRIRMHYWLIRSTIDVD